MVDIPVEERHAHVEDRHRHSAFPGDLFRSRVSWGAILAGLAVAIATMLLLSLLGLAIGFSTVDFTGEGGAFAGIPTGAAIWFIATQLIALGVGGYVAGRLAAVPRATSAALHGATLWALSALLLAWATTSTIGTIVSGATSVVTTVARGAGQAVGAVVPNSMPNIPIEDIAVSQLPPEVQQRLEAQGLTPEQIRQEARQAFRDVVSRREQARAVDAVQATATDILQNPVQAEQEIDTLVDRLVGTGGIISAQDRQEAAQALEQRLGLTPAEAQELVNRVEARVQALQQELRQTANNAQQEAAQLGDRASSALASAALWAFIASLAGLIAAVLGARAGKPATPIEERY